MEDIGNPYESYVVFLPTIWTRFFRGEPIAARENQLIFLGGKALRGGDCRRDQLL